MSKKGLEDAQEAVESIAPAIRIAMALEDIAASLQKLANPLMPASAGHTAAYNHDAPRKHGA